MITNMSQDSKPNQIRLLPQNIRQIEGRNVPHQPTQLTVIRQSVIN